MTSQPATPGQRAPRGREGVLRAELARRDELQPLIEHLLDSGKDAYRQLGPLARHVGEVPLDYPLRHQQVQGWGGDGPGGIVAGYLMIALGPDHGLTLYHNYDLEGRPFKWQVTRRFPLSETHYEQTQVEERPYPQPPLLAHHTGYIEVSRYRYGVPNRAANHAHDGFLCSTFNGYEGAEQYIADFETDIQEAVRRFGPNEPVTAGSGETSVATDES